MALLRMPRAEALSAARAAFVDRLVAAPPRALAPPASFTEGMVAAMRAPERALLVRIGVAAPRAALDLARTFHLACARRQGSGNHDLNALIELDLATAEAETEEQAVRDEFVESAVAPARALAVRRWVQRFRFIDLFRVVDAAALLERNSLQQLCMPPTKPDDSAWRPVCAFKDAGAMLPFTPALYASDNLMHLGARTAAGDTAPVLLPDARCLATVTVRCDSGGGGSGGGGGGGGGGGRGAGPSRCWGVLLSMRDAESLRAALWHLRAAVADGMPHLPSPGLHVLVELWLLPSTGPLVPGRHALLACASLTSAGVVPLADSIQQQRRGLLALAAHARVFNGAAADLTPREVAALLCEPQFERMPRASREALIRRLGSPARRTRDAVAVDGSLLLRFESLISWTAAAGGWRDVRDALIGAFGDVPSAFLHCAQMGAAPLLTVPAAAAAAVGARRVSGTRFADMCSHPSVLDQLSHGAAAAAAAAAADDDNFVEPVWTHSEVRAFVLESTGRGDLTWAGVDALVGLGDGVPDASALRCPIGMVPVALSLAPLPLAQWTCASCSMGNPGAVALCGACSAGMPESDAAAAGGAHAPRTNRCNECTNMVDVRRSTCDVCGMRAGRPSGGGAAAGDSSGAVDNVLGVAPAAARVSDVLAAARRGTAGIPFIVAALNAARTDSVRSKCVHALGKMVAGGHLGKGGTAIFGTICGRAFEVCSV